MAGTQGGPDLAKCFGRYQQQSVTYALANCLGCAKVKACVRAQWGLDQPQRLQRDSRAGYRRRLATQSTTRGGAREWLAT